MVRNEPFIYYSVKSIYPFCDSILLYDTGSYDKYTQDDIYKLISEDYDHKISFDIVDIDYDETKWSVDTIKKIRTENAGKFGTGEVRKMMIDKTDTDFFMIVDGDEVHYEETMTDIIRYLENWDESKIAGFIPLTWHTKPDKVFNCYSPTGRLFKTDGVGMYTASPDERHTNKATGKNISLSDDISIELPVKPYAHFEHYLKPWRRKVTDSIDFHGELPEVMLEDMSFVERFENEQKRLVSAKVNRNSL